MTTAPVQTNVKTRPKTCGHVSNGSWRCCLPSGHRRGMHYYVKVPCVL